MMDRRTAYVVWAVLAAVVLGVEAWALSDEDHRDTLSALVWLVREHGLGRVAFNALWAWLSWHFIVQPALPEDVEEAVRQTHVDDVGVVAVALLVSIHGEAE